ncbi:MAG: helix-turn-helix domain-containing protein [Halanaerobiaceae bacterium]|nr:helix-turn-helix domain-containing protein [Halanaerobiaceae bacterium]
MSIGEKLKKAREKMGLSFNEIQDAIKIRSKYLEALENDDFDVIPGEAYVRAFIKSYGNHLGLNGDELLEEYRILKEEEEKILLEEDEEENNKGGHELFQNKTLISIIIAVIILLILAILIYNIGLLNNSMNELEVSQPVENNFQVRNLVEQYDFPEKANNLPKEERENNEEDNFSGLIVENSQEILEETLKNIDIIITERSWIQVHADGEKVFEGILDKGENKEIAYQENVSMKIGNAAGVQVRKDDEILGPWGMRGEVIEKIID